MVSRTESAMQPISPSMFSRQDETDDGRFYVEPRFETHIDDATIAELTRVYRELLNPGSGVLDLMSSWISHLPDDVSYECVVGLGMNARELARNPQLDGAVVLSQGRLILLPVSPWGRRPSIVHPPCCSWQRSHRIYRSSTEHEKSGIFISLNLY